MWTVPNAPAPSTRPSVMSPTRGQAAAVTSQTLSQHALQPPPRSCSGIACTPAWNGSPLARYSSRRQLYSGSCVRPSAAAAQQAWTPRACTEAAGADR